MFLTKDLKLKNNAKAFLIMGAILVVLILIYFFGNFNRFTIVKLSGDDNGFIIKDALMIKTPRVNLIKIDNLSYNKKDFNIKSISIDLIVKKNNKILETIEYISPQEPTSLVEYLKTFRINLENKLSTEMTQVTQDIVLKIRLIDEHNQVIDQEVLLNKIRLSSKALIYF